MEKRKEKVNCPYVFRKPGRNTAHCRALAERGQSNDFCAMQYFCRVTDRWELKPEAARCILTENEREVK